MSRVDVALLLLVLFVIVFLFWSRNVVVRAPVAPTPVVFGMVFAADLPRPARKLHERGSGTRPSPEQAARGPVSSRSM